MTAALIGHTGFVGSNLRAQAKFDTFYNSRNFNELAGKSFDLVVCAGVSAVKWLANKEPEKDAAAIAALRQVLEQVSAREFVLISTVDVYPQPSGLDESADLRGLPNHAYGKHRLEFEEWAATRFPLARIVRLPALFGPHLKKNVLFDLLHDNNPGVVNPDSAFQWYPLERLWADIELIRQADLKLVNLMTEPVTTSRLIAARFEGKSDIGTRPAPAGRYDVRTRHAALFGGADGYVMKADDVIASYKSFIDAERRTLAGARGLAVSNIAWDSAEHDAALALLQKRGVTGIEVAPTKFWPEWQGATPEAAQKLGREMAGRGLAVSSLQAILFARPEARLFGSAAQRQNFHDSILYAADLASAFGGVPMVLGAPASRDPGELSPEACRDIAVEAFSKLAAECAARNVTLCLEANPRAYQCGFVNLAAEALDLAAAVHACGFAVNIDAGQIALTGEDVSETLRCAAPLVAHMQASQPFLEAFAGPDAAHRRLCDDLAAAGYRGWVSIEMRRQENTLEALEQAIRAVRSAYRPLLGAEQAVAA